MSRSIILEGPDGSGKTTLAKHLCDRYGFRYAHVDKPRPGEDVFKTYLTHLWKAILSPRPCVFDRLYLGETIYGPVMRGQSLLSNLQVRLLNRLKNANGVKEFVCLPSYDSCFKSWSSGRPEYVEKEQDFKTIYSKYIDAGHLWSDGFIDWTQYLHYDNQETISQLFEPKRILPRSVIGSPQARLLIVGEQINKRKTSTDWAFFSDSASSGYINEALKPIDEVNLAFVNAFSPSGTIKDFVDITGSLPRFKLAVALGRKAELVLTRQGIPHIQLPHPAYVKRFAHDKMAEYTFQFIEALESTYDGERKPVPHTLAAAAQRGNEAGGNHVTPRKKDKGADPRPTGAGRPKAKRAGAST